VSASPSSSRSVSTRSTWTPAASASPRGKGGKDRYVPFPTSFRETLALHIGAAQDKGATFLFESSWKKPYSTRGVRAMLARYAAQAGLEHNMAPHRLRHFLFTWLKTQGIDDALIQPYSGHHSRTSLEMPATPDTTLPENRWPRCGARSQDRQRSFRTP
jgi:site-specific recombinase XerD